MVREPQSDVRCLEFNGGKTGLCCLGAQMEGMCVMTSKERGSQGPGQWVSLGRGEGL